MEKCPHPRSISKLVIVPKLAPGQSKENPEHGFRVCVNALINKCLKPCASTIPLATDEITKLFNERIAFSIVRVDVRYPDGTVGIVLQYGSSNRII